MTTTPIAPAPPQPAPRVEDLARPARIGRAEALLREIERAKLVEVHTVLIGERDRSTIMTGKRAGLTRAAELVARMIRDIA